MAKLHFVKKARKAIPEAGIEVGDSYYFYKKRINGKGVPKVCSKNRPKRSAYSTSSPFLGTLMNKEDELNELLAKGISVDEVSTWLESVAQEVEALGEECQTKASNVELEMKNGSGATSAEMLQARATHCLELASAIREVVSSLEARGNVDLSEDVGDGESMEEPVSLADVVSGLVWLL